jgi:hypothetical protein
MAVANIKVQPRDSGECGNSRSLWLGGTRPLTSEQSAGPWDRLAVHHPHCNCNKAVTDDVITQTTADRSASRSGQTHDSSIAPAFQMGPGLNPTVNPVGFVVDEMAL